jgi:hypothetical protein
MTKEEAIREAAKDFDDEPLRELKALTEALRLGASLDEIEAARS